jgi:nogalonic acid methyl ester cyclase/aklanonic acid methyl ester cyclase
MADTLEGNKAIMRRMLEAFNSGKTEVVAELLHPSIRDHSRKLGLEAQVRDMDPVRRVKTEILRHDDVFPDKKFKEVVLVAEGDTVVLQWQLTGTHKGALMGHRATGKRVETYGVEIIRIKDGKIIEHRDDGAHVFDVLYQLDLLQPDVVNLLKTGDPALGAGLRTAPA